MEIEFDPFKNLANLAKHVVSMAEADGFEWNESLVRADDRYEYGERRMSALGYIGNRLHVVVFVDRDGVRRIISLRKANKREERIYAET